MRVPSSFASLAGIPLAFAALTVAGRARATSYEVGAAQMYKSPCLLLATVTPVAGDVILVDAGTYTDACQVKPSGAPGNPIILRGAPGPRPVFDATGVDLSGSGSVPRAIFQFTGGSHWRVEHLELTHGSNASNNGAGFRSTAGSDDIVFYDVSIHDNQDGAMSDGTGTVSVLSSDIYKNGANDGQSHNFYLLNDTVILSGNHIHDSVGGQNVKIRSHFVELLYNRIENAGNYEIDLIEGTGTTAPNSHAVLIGNVVLRNPTAANDGQTIVFGTDGTPGTGRNGNFYALYNTFVMTAATNKLVHVINPAPGAQIFFYDNVIHATVAGTAIGYDAASDALFQGSNNWVTSGIGAPAGLTASVTGADPMFASGGYFPAAGSPVVGGAIGGRSFLDGAGKTEDGTPVSEYDDALLPGPFQRPAAKDLGAFEHGAPGAPLDGGVAMDAGAPPADAGDAGGPVTVPFDASFGGSPDASPGNGVAPGTGTSSGCGCVLAGKTAGGGSLSVLVGLAVAMVGRRRRRRLNGG